MRTAFLYLISIMFFSCKESKTEVPIVEPFDKGQIEALANSAFFKAPFRMLNDDEIDVKILIKYLASIESVDSMGKLYSNIKFKTLPLLDSITLAAKYPEGKICLPFLIGNEMLLKNINKSDKKYLFSLIKSKQPSIPVSSYYVGSHGKDLSTIGIEAMHILNATTKNGYLYPVSNLTFCPNENQDSMVTMISNRWFIGDFN